MHLYHMDLELSLYSMPMTTLCAEDGAKVFICIRQHKSKLEDFSLRSKKVSTNHDHALNKLGVRMDNTDDIIGLIN